MRLAAFRGGEGRGEEKAQLEDAARRGNVLVGRDPADRGFVHAYGLGDRAQVERPQMADAVDEERVLAAHDLGGDLEDGAGALIQAARQPVGALQALRKEFPVLARGGAGADPGIVGLIDQDARQGVGVELDEPASVCGGAHHHVGHDRVGRPARELRARFRIEAADFGQHVDQVLLVDPAQPLERREVAPRQKIEIGDHGLHGGVVAVARGKLQRKALGEVAREQPGRFEALADRQNRAHGPAVCAKPDCEFVEVEPNVSGLVEPLGELARQCRVGRIGEGERDLLLDVVAQRHRRGRHVLQVEALRRPAGNVRLPQRREFGRQRLARAWIVGKEVLQRSAELAGYLLGAPLQLALEPVGRLGRRGCLGDRLDLRLGRVRRAFEQRVALDLVVDEAVQLDMSELQQPDRLHELRRHHQRLRLSELEPGGQCHADDSPAGGARDVPSMPGIWIGPAFACQAEPSANPFDEALSRRRIRGSKGDGCASEREIVAEIEPAHVGVLDNFVRPAVGEHLPGMDDIGAIDQAERLADVMVGDQHADAAPGQVPDELLDVGDGDRVDAGERLVEQHEVWPAGERTGDLQPATLAARQRDGRRLAQMRDRELLQQFVEALLALLSVLLGDLEYGADVVLDGKAAEDRGLLRQVADAEPRAAVHRHRRDVVAVYLDRALVDRHEAGDHVEAGRLARPVGSEQAHSLARAHPERYAADHLPALVALGEAARDQRAREAPARGSLARRRRDGGVIAGGRRLNRQDAPTY